MVFWLCVIVGLVIAYLTLDWCIRTIRKELTK
jgi:hypothetical protein